MKFTVIIFLALVSVMGRINQLINQVLKKSCTNKEFNCDFCSSANETTFSVTQHQLWPGYLCLIGATHMLWNFSNSASEI